MIWFFVKGFLWLQHGEQIKGGQQWFLQGGEKRLGGCWTFPVFCGIVLHRESPEDKKWVDLRAWDANSTYKWGTREAIWKGITVRLKTLCGVCDPERRRPHTLWGGQVILITRVVFVTSINHRIIMCQVLYKFNFI